MIESKHPGANLAFFIGQQENKEALLRDPAQEQDFYEVLGDGQISAGQDAQLEDACQRFAAWLSERHGLTTFGKAERQAVRDDIAGIGFSQDASAFARTALAEFSFCCLYGQKRSNEECPEGCHYTGYLCYQVQNCASNRLPISLRRYAQRWSGFWAASRSRPNTCAGCCPLCSPTATQWRDAYVAARERESRRDPLPLHLAKQATAESWRRFAEQREDIMGALAVAARILAGEDVPPSQGDHPIFAEIQRDLGIETAW